MALPAPVAALGLAVVLAYPVLALVRDAPADPDWRTVRRGLARTWALGLAVAALALLFGSPADLALDAPAVGTLIDGFLFGFIAFAGTMLAVGLVARAAGGTRASRATLAVLEGPARRKLAVAVTGAVVESLLFYGYAIEAVAGLGLPAAAGAGLGAACAVVGRARWSVREAVQWAPGAFVLAGIALWSRSLYVVVLVRLVYDTVTLLSGDPEDYRTE